MRPTWSPEAALVNDYYRPFINVLLSRGEEPNRLTLGAREIKEVDLGALDVSVGMDTRFRPALEEPLTDRSRLSPLPPTHPVPLAYERSLKCAVLAKKNAPRSQRSD